jgi:hypothetical protein
MSCLVDRRRRNYKSRCVPRPIRFRSSRRCRMNSLVELEPIDPLYYVTLAMAEDFSLAAGTFPRLLADLRLESPHH